MVEKTMETPQEERFDFVLSVNGNVICKRNFGIDNFQDKSVTSVQLTDALWDCMKIIDADLREKTNIYNELTAPQVFQNVEEMEKWAKNPTFHLNVPSFVILRDSEDVYIWDGEKMREYNRSFNRSDYVGEATQPCVLRFSFFDNGEEVRYVEWDGSKYPKFIRTNIDITNSKNKFEAEGVYAPFEAYIVNQFNRVRQDITPNIKRKLIYACSNPNTRYFSTLFYGEKKYTTNLKGYNESLFFKEKGKRD